jgi:outer membrane protein assembly factor BamB
VRAARLGGRAVALGVIALAGGCATGAYTRAGSGEDVANALSGHSTEPARPANTAGRPLVFLSLGGARGARLAAYDLGESRLLWTQPADLKGRVEVGADTLVHAAAGGVVARDLATGAVRWQHAVASDERLLGYAIDGQTAYVVAQSGGQHLHGGTAALVALDARSGAVRWRHALPSGNAGGPVARSGLVAVPVQSQYVTLLDGQTGEQLAQVLSSEEAATFVRALPEGFFFGSRGVFRLSPETAGGSRRSGGYLRATLPAFVRPVYDFDLYRPEQMDYSALDRNRILWRTTNEAHPRFRDDLAFVHNFRFFFGFDATKGVLRWAYNHPATEAVASADTGEALLFATADGELGALDARTGQRLYAAHLPGEVVRGATFDAEGYTPHGGLPAGASTPPLSEVLSTIIWDPDRRFWDVKMFAIEELARQPGREVTGQLLKITQQEGLPAAVYQKAGEALVARKDASAADLLADVLKVHADYADDRAAPAVEILARAAGAMKAKAATAALVAHLRRPETTPAAVTQLARALAAIGAVEALPALRDFVMMYRSDPLYDGDPTALVAVSEAMLTLGGAPQRTLLLYLSEEPHTVEALRAHLRRALAQTAGAGERAGAGASMAASPDQE